LFNDLRLACKSVQVAVEQAAQASPTGNLARKVRAVFQGAEQVVQAAAALRMHTAGRARTAQEAAHGLACSADACTVKEHQEMLARYKIKYYATAMQRYGEQAIVDDQVSFPIAGVVYSIYLVFTFRACFLST
jgi:hypothetical protein